MSKYSPKGDVSMPMSRARHLNATSRVKRCTVFPLFFIKCRQFFKILASFVIGRSNSMLLAPMTSSKSAL